MTRERGFGSECGRDWGGRRKLNPDNCPHVSGKDVREYAQKHNIKIMREGLGMWFFFDGKTRYTLGQTNFLALEWLKRIVLEGEG